MEKAGWKTTEFWTSLAALVGGFAATMGYMTPEMSSELTTHVGQAAGGVIGIVGIIMYVWSRARVKTGSK